MIWPFIGSIDSLSEKPPQKLDVHDQKKETIESELIIMRTNILRRSSQQNLKVLHLTSLSINFQSTRYDTPNTNRDIHVNNASEAKLDFSHLTFDSQSETSTPL